jgi:hypothetical protein
MRRRTYVSGGGERTNEEQQQPCEAMDSDYMMHFADCRQDGPDCGLLLGSQVTI